MLPLELHKAWYKNNHSLWNRIKYITRETPVNSYHSSDDNVLVLYLDDVQLSITLYQHTLLSISNKNMYDTENNIALSTMSM